MHKKLFVLLAVLVLASLTLTACGGGTAKKEEPKPVPAEFAGKTNPLGADAAAAGMEVFSLNCASCHGETGKGDGPAGASLDPRPADLVAEQASLKDDFLFWVISEGGSAAGLSPSMASYKDLLSEEEIWQIVSYIRSLK